MGVLRLVLVTKMEALNRIARVQRVRNINRLRRHRRIYRRRENTYNALSDREFKQRYRVSKEVFQFIVNLIRRDISPQLQREDYLNTEMQVLIALRFFAKGMYQRDNGDLHGISQSTVSRVIKKISLALASHLHEFVKFEPNDGVKKEFYNIGRMPNIVASLDCTHIKIKNPDSNRAVLYCNRKGFYSLNVQVACDANCRIVDLVARWRGSAHDSRIWNQSALKAKFENREVNGIILGDAGYPCRPYLLTPVANPKTPEERAYNYAHARTRSTIERCFGQWKAIFRSLRNGLDLSLDTIKASIAAMAVLYNIKKDMDSNEDPNSESSEDTSDDEDEMPELDANENITGNIFRREYIRKYFSR